MPYKSNNTSKQSKRPGGDPAGRGVEGMKDIDAESSLKAMDELGEKYTDENGEPDIGPTTGSHPNRNTNKPNIDKPAYG
jgi:hypothetical protein